MLRTPRGQMDNMRANKRKGWTDLTICRADDGYVGDIG